MIITLAVDIIMIAIPIKSFSGFPAKSEQITATTTRATVMTKCYGYNAPKLQTFTDQCSC